MSIQHLALVRLVPHSVNINSYVARNNDTLITVRHKVIDQNSITKYNDSKIRYSLIPLPSYMVLQRSNIMCFLVSQPLCIIILITSL